MKLSKIFIIVLALHVLVIGGILGFHAYKSKKHRAENLASTTETTSETTPAPDASQNGAPLADVDSLNAGTPTADPNAMANSGATVPMTAPATATPAVQTTGAVPTATPAGALPADMQAQATQAVSAVATAAQPVVQQTAEYVVQKGDALVKIARKHNVTVAAVRAANNMTNDFLKVGQKLIIPLPDSSSMGAATTTMAPAAVATIAPAVSGSYSVVKGDSLYKIAKRHGVTVAALKAANNLATDNLSIGQSLSIPSAQAPVAAAPVVAQAPIPAGANVHVVAKGDSLYKIARANGMTVEALKTANNLTSDRLSIGQQIQIPSNQPVSQPAPVPAMQPVQQQAVSPAPTPMVMPPAVVDAVPAAPGHAAGESTTPFQVANKVE